MASQAAQHCVLVVHFECLIHVHVQCACTCIFSTWTIYVVHGLYMYMGYTCICTVIPVMM